MTKKSELAPAIIDLVEEAIRKEHSKIDEIAKNFAVEDHYKPNTLLYGEAYYKVEEEIIKILSGIAFEKERRKP